MPGSLQCLVEQLSLSLSLSLSLFVSLTPYSSLLGVYRITWHTATWIEMHRYAFQPAMAKGMAELSNSARDPCGERRPEVLKNEARTIPGN